MEYVFKDLTSKYFMEKVEMSKVSIFLVFVMLVPVTGFSEEAGGEIMDCYHVSTDGRRNGTITGAVTGTAIGGGLCMAGVALAALSFGITAVVGCAAGGSYRNRNGSIYWRGNRRC